MTETNRKASATARTRATTKYHKAHYKRMYISTTPDQADYIRETAKQFDISIVQLIINSVNEYKMNHGADTDEETAEKPQEENETENEIETEEEPEEDEDIPEELKAVRAAWARMGAFNEKITAERKAREAAERKRRRLGDIED